MEYFTESKIYFKNTTESSTFLPFQHENIYSHITRRPIDVNLGYWVFSSTVAIVMHSSYNEIKGRRFLLWQIDDFMANTDLTFLDATSLV